MSKPTPPSPRRPRRPDNPAAPVPVNLGDPAVEAFMRGGRPVGTGEGANDTVAPAVTFPSRSPIVAEFPPTAPPDLAVGKIEQHDDAGETGRNIVVKLPERIARLLDEIAAKRAAFRARVATKLLHDALSELEASIARDGTPDLPPPVPATRRSIRSLTLRLDAKLADRLDRITGPYEIVQHQLLLRLLVPAIERLHTGLFPQQ